MGIASWVSYTGAGDYSKEDINRGTAIIRGNTVYEKEPRYNETSI